MSGNNLFLIRQSDASLTLLIDISSENNSEQILELFLSGGKLVHSEKLVIVSEYNHFELNVSDTFFGT